MRFVNSAYYTYTLLLFIIPTPTPVEDFGILCGGRRIVGVISIKAMKQLLAFLVFDGNGPFHER